MHTCKLGVATPYYKDSEQYYSATIILVTHRYMLLFVDDPKTPEGPAEVEGPEKVEAITEDFGEENEGPGMFFAMKYIIQSNVTCSHNW